MTETKVIPQKAENVTDFRHELKPYKDESEDNYHWEFSKSRNINDFHHAHDAYLNIVVGNCYDVRFTRDIYNYVKE